VVYNVLFLVVFFFWVGILCSVLAYLWVLGVGGGVFLCQCIVVFMGGYVSVHNCSFWVLFHFLVFFV